MLNSWQHLSCLLNSYPAVIISTTELINISDNGGFNDDVVYADNDAYELIGFNELKCRDTDVSVSNSIRLCATG